MQLEILLIFEKCILFWMSIKVLKVKMQNKTDCIHKID